MSQHTPAASRGLRDSIPIWLRAPRASTWLIAALTLLLAIAIVSPVQLPVVLYKTALIAFAVVLGYWIDRVLFPYSRPDSYLERDWRYGTEEPEGDADYRVTADHMAAFCVALIRRAIVVSAVLIAMATGL